MVGLLLATASWSSCEGTLQLLEQDLPHNAVAAEYLQLILTATFAVATAVLHYMRLNGSESSRCVNCFLVFFMCPASCLIPYSKLLRPVAGGGESCRGGCGGVQGCDAPLNLPKCPFSTTKWAKNGVFVGGLRGVRFKKSTFWVQKVHFLRVLHPPNRSGCGSETAVISSMKLS